MRVRHPILHLEIVDEDGRTISSAHRAYCALRMRSVEIGTCCACLRCDEIVAAPQPAVVCTLPPEDDRPTLDVHVGRMLDRGAVAISPEASAVHARRVLVTTGRRELPVVDVSTHVVLGVVRDVGLERHVDVQTAMSSPLYVRESMTVREALRVLASAHLREVTVVNDDGVPIGVFRDVDGPKYDVELNRQITAAREKKGEGDLNALYNSGETWTVG